jgi:hypothetical protein
MITSTRTQPTLLKWNTTWWRKATMKKELIMTMMSKIYFADLDKMKIAAPDNDGIGGSKLLVDKSSEEYKAAQEAAEKVRKEALANASNHHHAQSYKSWH